MQYSRALLTVVLTVVVIPASQGQQPAASQSGRRLAIECDHAVPPAGMHWVCSDRNNPCNCRLESDRAGGGMLDGEGESQSAGKISSAGFEQMMNALAAAKGEGSSMKAAELFAENAVGSNLTTGQIYRGREAAAKLFAGSKRSGQAVTLQWHHLLFDEKNQIGVGEFTLEGNPHYHGVLILKLESGKISHWREYRLASSRSWDSFTAANQF